MKKCKMALALTTVMLFQSQVALAQCTVNGKEVPCDLFWKKFGWIFISMGTVLGVLFVVSISFWLWMLIDCLKSSREDKLVWTLVLLFGNIIGALLYFFIAKGKSE